MPVKYAITKGRGYRDTVAKLVKSYGDYNLLNITVGHLQKGAAQRLKEVSPKTVCNEVVIIKEMLKHAYIWGYVKTSPGSAIFHGVSLGRVMMTSRVFF